MGKINIYKKNVPFYYNNLFEKIKVKWNEVDLDKEKFIVLYLTDILEIIQISRSEVLMRSRKNSPSNLKKFENLDIYDEDYCKITIEVPPQSQNLPKKLKNEFQNDKVLKYSKALRCVNFLCMINQDTQHRGP